MLKIKWFDSPYNLGEIGQKTGIIFSFITEKGVQCHPWVKCRDFLQDAVSTTVTGRANKIYGFNYDLKDKAFSSTCMDKTLMLVSKQDLLKVAKKDIKESITKFEKKMEAALNLLNYYEDVAGEVHSKVTMQQDGGKWYWLFESPAFWMKSSALVSMYTFLIRLGDKEIEFDSAKELLSKYKELLTSDKHGNDNDINYLKVCWSKLYIVAKRAKQILLEGGDIDTDYKKVEATREMHNRGGIRSLCGVPCVYVNKAKALKIFNGVA